MSKHRFLSRTDHLWLAVFLSLLLHGLALVYFWPATPAALSKTLDPEISLINYQTDATDLEAVLLAINSPLLLLLVKPFPALTP